ncbi:MAG TPA: GtrA family protein [Patescibacteria group bacterium]|nr:GtrA family protein [Patescibacteria group bacterium]
MPERLIIRYGLVGGIAYAMELLTLFGLKVGLGLSPVHAVAISFWVGFVIAFLLQKIIAFENHEKTPHIVGKQLVLYGLLTVWNYGFTLLAVDLFQHHASVFVIRSCALALIVCWNFAAYQRLFPRGKGKYGHDEN